MTRKGVASSDMAETLEKLTKAGMIDDLRFARAWVTSRDRFNPRGKAVLRQELYLKGISKDLIAQVLQERDDEAADQSTDQPTELELVQQLVKGRERLYANLDPETRKRRLLAYLSRRGFSYDVIRRIL